MSRSSRRTTGTTPSSRVSTTDWATSGIVSSRCTRAATALKLLPTLGRSPLGLPAGLGIAAAALLATVWLAWPLAWVVAGPGSLAVGLAWRRLAQ